MPIYHLVWFKFNDDVPESRIAAHLAALRSLPAHVPDILSLAVGANFTQRAEGFTHGLVVVLRDKAALAAYAVHPHHVTVASAVARDAQLRALDFEFDPA